MTSKLPSHSGPRLIAVLSVLLGIVAIASPTGRPVAPPGSYASLHILVELPSVAVAIAIGLVAWHTRRIQSSWLAPLGPAFASLALLDASHMMTFGGMPFFVVEPGTQPSIAFWLASRFLAFGVLGWLAWTPTTGRRSPAGALWWCTLLIAPALWVVLATAPDLLPVFHRPETGLTTIKLVSEYAMVAVGLAAIARFTLRARSNGESPDARRQLEWLAAAAFSHTLAEVAFTRYIGPADLANLVGHGLKILGDVAAFEALFVATVRQPFDRQRNLRARVQRILGTMPDPWLVVDARGRITAARTPTDGALDLPDHPDGRTLPDLVGPDAWSILQSLAASGDPDATATIVRDHVWDVRAALLPESSDGPGSILIIARDRTADLALEEELRIADLAFDAPIPLLVVDADGVMLRTNRAFGRLTGRDPDDHHGRPMSSIAPDASDVAAWDAALNAAARGEVSTARVRVRGAHGGPVHVDLSMRFVMSERAHPSHAVIALQDLTEKRQAAEEIHRLAWYDGLTQLPNRRLLATQLDRAIRAARRSGRFGAVLFLDLDHFKVLNDTRGHDTGDRLLTEVGRRLLERTRGEDIVARLGGDEFVIVLQALGEQAADAAAIARRVASDTLALLSRPYEVAGPDDVDVATYHTSASIGVSLFGPEPVSVDDVLKQADIAMYQAKDDGRNVVRFFDPVLQARIEHRSRLADAMHGALERGEYHVAWQPQVTAKGRPIGAEALLRWHHPELGPISPAEFIPVAEDLGTIESLGLFVLEAACRRLAEWRRDPSWRHLSLSVNVSARQLHDDRFIPQLIELLERTGAPPDRLVVELTERMILRASREVEARLSTLRQTGVRLSMDDFGTGYSSLALLKRLPLNEVKIDRAFVADLPDDPDSVQIATAIVGIGRGLGLAVVAEGVETRAHVDLLSSLGCEVFQGFLFARPMRDSELDVWLKDTAPEADAPEPIAPT